MQDVPLIEMDEMVKQVLSMSVRLPMPDEMSFKAWFDHMVNQGRVNFERDGRIVPTFMAVTSSGGRRTNTIVSLDMVSLMVEGDIRSGQIDCCRALCRSMNAEACMIIGDGRFFSSFMDSRMDETTLVFLFQGEATDYVHMFAVEDGRIVDETCGEGEIVRGAGLLHRERVLN
jgi:hypothetical protein